MNQIEITPGLRYFFSSFNEVIAHLKRIQKMLGTVFIPFWSRQSLWSILATFSMFFLLKMILSSQTPIYILATAGMRVLSKKSQKIIYNNIYTCYLKSDIKMYMDITQLNTIDGICSFFVEDENRWRRSFIWLDYREYSCISRDCSSFSFRKTPSLLPFYWRATRRLWPV